MEVLLRYDRVLLSLIHILIDALENEDAFYQFENYSLKKQRGYYIYYETNQEMKNYMLAEGEDVYKRQNI